MAAALQSYRKKSIFTPGENRLTNTKFKMAAKFEITTRKNGEFQFNLKAANGQTILSSEGYTTKSAAMNGIESVRKNSAREGAFEVKEAKNGQFYFLLKATNGQVIGQSEMYAAMSGLKNGIESVRKNAPEAVIDDQTAK
jgi:uncharacterized protein YegP (UPF0339 family)